MTNFFRNLPTISYDGVPAKNFLAVAKLSDATLNDASLYYPYTVSDADTPDLVSKKYYDDHDFMWLIWMTNNVVDPYHDTYLNDMNFHRFIEKKYGSIEAAQSTVAYYQNNWSIDETELGVDEYNSLPSLARKYYQPIVDGYNNVIGYNRKRVDWQATTNKIVSMGTTSNASFTIGETISQFYSNNSLIANGVVVFSNTSIAIVQHTEGNFVASNSSVFAHLRNSSNTIIANTTSVDTQTCIPADELGYWTQITYYEHESVNNARRRDIQLIDNRFKGTIASQLKAVMSE